MAGLKSKNTSAFFVRVRKEESHRQRQVLKKCYSTAVRVPGLRDVSIKITHTVLAPITIIQHLDEHEHCHTLQRSREIAPSKLALHLAATEAAKGYAPAQFLNALRGIRALEGSKRLIEVGGAHLTWCRIPTLSVIAI